MSEKGYYYSLAECPFYIRDDPHQVSITCEGFAEENRLKTQFLTRDAWREHIENRCRERYTQCPVYKMLLQNWEETH